MHKKIMKHLTNYLNYLDSQPDTKINQQIIDCINYLAFTKPDTEESLNG